MQTDPSISYSLNLISLEKYFDEMVKLHESNNFPKVFLLNGQKGIGKFTLVMHFLNYIYSMDETTKYNIKNKLVNIKSNFYNSILNQTCSNVIFLKAEEEKNIKIDDTRNLKSYLSRSSLSNKQRFIIIDDVEFLNNNSANALLKILEEPTKNNYFILINNKQAELNATISSRCLRTNIFLNTMQKKNIIEYLLEENKENTLIEYDGYLSPGLYFNYNKLLNKYKVDRTDNIKNKVYKLLYGYQKDKNKTIISLSVFLIEGYFHKAIRKDNVNIDSLINLKSSIVNKIYYYTEYNLNIKSVISFIELKFNNV
jgi:DNA polymerase III delta prime subunit